jgi:hypothetical protein
VGFALSDVLLLLAAHLGRAALGRHSVTPEFLVWKLRGGRGQ